MSNRAAGAKSLSESHVINSFVELRQRAQSAGPKRVAVVVADDEIALTAAEEALNLGIAHILLIGNARRIREKVDAVLLTGGMAHSERVVRPLSEYIAWIAPISVYPGDDELRALSEGLFQVLDGHEQPKKLQPRPLTSPVLTV